MGSQPAILVGAWIARSVLRSGPCEPRGLTVSHACDPRMHREPGILNRAYAKTVKLNPVISTQERGVEKPRAPPACKFIRIISRKWKVLYLDSLQPTGCAWVYTSPNGASHIELPGSPPGWKWSICVSELSSSE